MSLTTRLSAFFLAALAAILVGFSIALYALAHGYLYRQLDARLIGALDTLEAAVDIESGGLEWEPEDRRLPLRTNPELEQIRWAVTDEQGRVIDSSANLANADFPVPWQPTQWPLDPPDGTVFGNVADWRLAARRLRLAELLRSGRGHSEDDGPDDDIEYPLLYLRAAMSSAPIEATLRPLAGMLLALPVGAWLVCAAIGRRLCRAALKPLSQMAGAARTMNATNLDRRLPVPATGDELADLGDAFNGLLGRLEETLDRQQRFAGDASHQLRTPLAGLLSQVEVVRRRQRSGEEYEQALDRVHVEATRMRQIVESLLFLSRSQSDAMILDCQSVDLTIWLAEQLERWKHHPRNGDLCLAADFDGPALIGAQLTLLSQLLDNLIDNAIKYSSAGSPITIGICLRPGSLGFYVEDQGRGIAAGDLPHVFEPFYRTQDARRQGTSGVGLGLGAVERIATNLGGRVDVRSEVGHGTRVSVSFAPAAAVAAKTPQPLVK